jgi:hypothetical protein
VGRPPWAHLGQWGTYTRYLSWFDRIFGAPLLVACLVGLAVVAAKREWRGTRFVLLWVGLVWVQQTLIAWKEPRYFVLALPAAALLVGRGWTLWPYWRRFPAGFIPIAGLIGYQFVAGMAAPAPRLRDYSAAVQLLVERGDADIVLMNGVRDGQFVFDVRTNPKAAGRIITFRGSKFLYSRTARGRWRHLTQRGTRERIIELLNQYGIRYVVAESRLPAMPEAARADWDEPASKVLLEVLADSTRFEQIGRFPLACGDPAWDDVYLLVYRYRDAPPRRTKTATIPVPALGSGRKGVTVELP